MQYINKYSDLSKLYYRNTTDVQHKIIKVLEEPISNADKVGYIYGFYSPYDTFNKNNYFIKLGRTDRNPFTRVEKEWCGNLVFCIKTGYNHRLERLVHLFFDYASEERFDANKEKPKISFWKKIFCCFKKTETKYNREIEWFRICNNTNVVSLVSQIWHMLEDITGNNSFTQININIANIDDLMTIPFITKTVANNIIKQRNKRKFSNIYDIKNVHKNINNNFDKIKFRITV